MSSKNYDRIDSSTDADMTKLYLDYVYSEGIEKKVGNLVTIISVNGFLFLSIFSS